MQLPQLCLAGKSGKDGLLVSTQARAAVRHLQTAMAQGSSSSHMYKAQSMQVRVKCKCCCFRSGVCRSACLLIHPQ
jgi:hypothetical protein